MFAQTVTTLIDSNKWKGEIYISVVECLLACASFRSVVVITLASHARGPGFETQRKHVFQAYPLNLFFSKG